MNAAKERAEEAGRRYERLASLLRVDPDNEGLYRQCVDSAIEAGRYAEAVELADARLVRKGDDAMALFDRATGLIGQRSYRAALEALAGLREANAASPAVQFNKALCHYCLQEYEQARGYLESCYAQGMRDVGVLRLLVSSYHHVGMLDEAVEIAKNNEAPAKTDAALAGVYALMYLDADDAMRAARWAATALQLNPKSIDGRVTQATLLTARVQTDKARAMLEDVLEDAPQTGRAWLGLGTLDLLARDLPAAKQRLQRGLELMPTHVGSWHVLAWAQMLAGEIDEAQRNFEHALEMDRNFAETHGGLAAIAAIRGESERARQLIEVALRLDPECLSARFAESLLMRRAGDATGADKLVFDTVADLSTKDSSALSQLLAKARKH